MRRARSHLTLVLVCVALPGAVVACSRTKKLDDEPTSTTTLTSGEVRAAAFVSNHEAIAHLMEASCTREAECLTPGVSPDESSHEECFRRVGRSLQNRLGAESCPLGIVGSPLERCLKGLQQQACGSSTDAVDRLPLCQAAELCRLPSTPSEPPLIAHPKL